MPQPVDSFGLEMSVHGIGAVRDQVQTLEEGIVTLLQQPITIGSDLPYAFGIHYGYFKTTGGVARARGGTFSLSGAIGKIYPRIGPEIAAALPMGAHAVTRALQHLRDAIVEETQRREVVGVGTRDPGALRRSWAVPRTVFDLEQGGIANPSGRVTT
jgi:hypothetical protein